MLASKHKRGCGMDETLSSKLCASQNVNNIKQKNRDMALSQRVSFMFCDLCGTMLSLHSKEYAECPLCKFRKSAREVSGREVSYKVSAEDMRRDLGISNFEGKIEVKDMEINKKCEKCSNTKLKFSTRQMRSADEGQTTFYHCPKCLHTFSEN